MNRAADMNVLLDSGDECIKGSNWKASVQRYEANKMLEALDRKESLCDRSYRPIKCKEFVLRERGKTRPVKAPGIDDRVISKAHNQHILLPEIRKRVIYDNSASLKDRGNDFAKRRFETHVHKHYRSRGNNGGFVFFGDNSKFFDNLPHSGLKEQFYEFCQSEEERWLTDVLIDAFQPDVSYMTDEEYANAMNVIYNSLEHIGYKGPREKMLEKSCNIGSETSQSGGVYYPHKIDNYFKIVLGVDSYGRYMDDTHILGNTREELQEYERIYKQKHKEYGLFVNERKTRICPLNKPFVWLKVKYILTEDGRLIRNLSHDSIVRERRKIKAYGRLIRAGILPQEEAANSYRSWRGNALRHYDSYRTIGELDKLAVKELGGF